VQTKEKVAGGGTNSLYERVLYTQDPSLGMNLYSGCSGQHNIHTYQERGGFSSIVGAWETTTQTACFPVHGVLEDSREHGVLITLFRLFRAGKILAPWFSCA
jgi:hypothetical protein